MRIPWKVLSVTLAAMLIAGSIAAQETPTPEPLTPVQLRAVQAFEADGILEGTSSCSVEDCSGTVLRWEAAMWIIRLFNYQPTPHETFADVDSEQPYADFVETLYDEDITVGCLLDPLRFCPERPTSRGQMAAFVTRAYDLDDTDPPHGYSDVSPTNVFRDNISALKNTGILILDCSEGEGLFCPYSPIDVAEAVEWLYTASLLEGTEDQEDGTDDGETEDREDGTGDGETGNGGNGNGGNGNGGNGGNGNGGNGNGNGDVGGGGTDGIGETARLGTPDINDDLQCTHFEPHGNKPEVPERSYLLVGEWYFDGEGNRAAFTTVYAHSHAWDPVRWWYWITEDARDQSGMPFTKYGPHTLADDHDDPYYRPEPCTHDIPCPAHNHNAGTDAEYRAGSHYYGEDSTGVLVYFHSHDGGSEVWNYWEGDTETPVGDNHPPCVHGTHQE